MRTILSLLFICALSPLFAQQDEWTAPEGFTLNYRTLTWDDFKGREDKEHATKLAEKNLQALAYVCPAIYFTADGGERLDNGRAKFNFHVKCAFQSRAFVRESTKQDHSNYVLTHEQDHYDIALIYSNLLKTQLTTKDYSADKYNEEIDKIYNDLMDKYHKTQERYDHEVNPDGAEDKPKQYLWDMRIKKCLDNNTDEYFSSPENVVQNVKLNGQMVKRLPDETDLQFVVRARPIYMEFPAEMTSKIVTTTEWGDNPSIVAFYTQKYYIEEDGALPIYNYRTLAYVFVNTVKDNYKRILIDTFSNMGKPVKISATFFANADSDNVKELVIIATSAQNDKGANGTMYIPRIYDNATKPLPARLKKLDEAATTIEGGFEGMLAGKTSKAKFKNEKEIDEGLKKKGYH